MLSHLPALSLKGLDRDGTWTGCLCVRVPDLLRAVWKQPGMFLLWPKVFFSSSHSVVVLSCSHMAPLSGKYSNIRLRYAT